MITINNQGKNNHILIHENYNICTFTLHVEGNNNTFFFDWPEHVVPTNHIEIAVFGSDNHIRVGSIFASRLTIHCVNGLTCTIGNRTSINGAAIVTNEPGSVQIGSDCLFSTGVKIHPTDFHKIYSHGKRINEPEPIVIGDKVWLCENVFVLKGSVIGSGSVIGAGAIVTGQIPGRSVAVGNPARVVRSDIDWEP